MCYFPDYDWISDADTVQQQQLNTSGYASGAYFVTSHPSRCAGLGILVESCFERRIESVINISINFDEMFVYQYRDNSMSQYERIGSRRRIRSQSLEVEFECDDVSADWIVEKGDIIAINLSDCFVNNNMMHICPIYPIFQPTMEFNMNTSVQFGERPTSFISQDGLTPPIPALLNVRARVGKSVRSDNIY